MLFASIIKSPLRDTLKQRLCITGKYNCFCNRSTIKYLNSIGPAISNTYVSPLANNPSCRSVVSKPNWC